MGNPSFDAAMLLRGLRAMDAALGETYDVVNHTCVPSPVVYASTFPAEGIDFTKYQGGFEGVKGVWKGWMYEDGGKGKLKSTVHDDVEATVVEAFELFEKIDKNKDGKIAADEWEKAQKGRKADDQLFDLEYLTALRNVTAKMMDLDQNKPLNPADPETYPEVQALKGEKQALETQLAASREETDLYQKTTLGLGALSGVLGTIALVLGVRAVLRGRGPAERAEAPKETAKDATKKEAPKAEAKPATDPDDMSGVLDELKGAKERTPPPPLPVVTPENVLIDGADAQPVKGVTPAVLKAQIALHFRHVLSQAAREALNDGKPLPDGADLVNSAFAADVDHLVDALLVEYADLAKKDPAGLEELWKDQKDAGHPIIRRGVPRDLLLKVAQDYIKAESARAGSPFAGDVADNLLRDAEKLSKQKDFYAKGLPELMRHIGR